MPTGTPVERTREVAFIVEAAAKRALEKSGEEGIVRNINIGVADRGDQPSQVSRSNWCRRANAK